MYLSSFLTSTLLRDKKPRDNNDRHPERSEGPHKVAMRVLPEPIQDKRTKLVECNLETLSTDERSLAMLGMTEYEAKDLTS
jgi:hypothetical protein